MVWSSAVGRVHSGKKPEQTLEIVRKFWGPGKKRAGVCELQLGIPLRELVSGYPTSNVVLFCRYQILVLILFPRAVYCGKS